MSIDAVISDVSRNPDGTATLHLMPRGNSLVGQPRLTVENPPANLEASIGTEIWGGCSEIMVGDTRWADRIGYTRIRLKGKKP